MKYCNGGLNLKPSKLGKHREFHKWLFFVGIIFLSWCSISYAVFRNFSTQKEAYLSAEAASFSSKIDSTLKTYELFSDYIFNSKINQPAILILMKRASETTDEVALQPIRDELYSTLLADYSRLTSYSFRQLQFLFPDGVSFLRFHAPEKFGDSLLNVRESIKIVSEKHQFASGFEEGKIYNGYRFVYPLFYQEDFIGISEVSISMASLIDVVHTLYPTHSTYFIIPKETVMNSLFTDQLDNYSISSLSPSFYSDVSVEQVSRKTDQLLDEKSHKELFSLLSNSIQSNLSTHESFTKSVRLHNKNYLVIFNAIYSPSHVPTAYLISITENKQLTTFKMHLWTEIGLVSLLSLVFILFSYLYLLDQIHIKQIYDYDFLTKLFNRRKFTELSYLELQRYKRHQKPFSILLMDIDLFKAINDHYGHKNGDIVLQELSQIITEQLRNIDVLGRWGGEEFIILLPETDAQDAYLVAERIRIAVSQHPFKVSNSVTVSVGISEVTSTHRSLEQLIDDADQAMYRAKNNGRNCCSF